MKRRHHQHFYLRHWRISCLAFSLSCAVTNLAAEPPIASPATPPTQPGKTQSIKYCDNISEKLHLYANSEELFADFTIKAQTKALQELLATELQQFSGALLSQEELYSALQHIVEYGKVDRVSEGVLTPCVVLTEAKISAEYRQRFVPVEIGRICSYDPDILQKEVAQVKKGLIDTLFTPGKNAAQPQMLAELLDKQPDKIANKYGKKLTELVHERDAQASAGAIAGTSCKSLVVYPIEFYALSVQFRDELKDKNASAETAFQKIADMQANLHGLDPHLFRALVQQESNWRASAVSHQGAVGLTQLMPATAKSECNLDEIDLHNPRKNLSCGARYLAKQLKSYKSIESALCAYNAGPGTVLEGRCQELQETRRYVRSIVSKMRKLERALAQEQGALLTSRMYSRITESLK